MLVFIESSLSNFLLSLQTASNFCEKFFSRARGPPINKSENLFKSNSLQISLTALLFEQYSSTSLISCSFVDISVVASRNSNNSLALAALGASST